MSDGAHRLRRRGAPIHSGRRRGATPPAHRRALPNHILKQITRADDTHTGQNISTPKYYSIDLKFIQVLDETVLHVHV